MPRIFISYRRSDSGPYAGRIYDRLASHFDSANIFMDSANLKPGDNFLEVLEKSVSCCDVLLAIIGREWLSAKDDEGRVRLGRQSDPLTLEVSLALERPETLVIPVLVEGARMPKVYELPMPVKNLAHRQAMEIDNQGFHQSIQSLIQTIEQHAQNPERHQSASQKHNPHADYSGRTLPEDLYLLASNSKDGYIAFLVTQCTCFQLALMAELALRNRIDLEKADNAPNRWQSIKPLLRDQTPTNDPMLDNSLNAFIKTGNPASLDYYTEDEIIERVRGRLESQGIIERREKSRWIFAPTISYPVVSTTSLNELRLQFSAAIEGDREFSDRIAALAGIISITEPNENISASLRARARQKAKENPIGSLMVYATDKIWDAIVDDGASNFVNAS
jgi:hypothetical protein